MLAHNINIHRFSYTKLTSWSTSITADTIRWQSWKMSQCIESSTSLTFAYKHSRKKSLEEIRTCSSWTWFSTWYSWTSVGTNWYSWTGTSWRAGWRQIWQSQWIRWCWTATRLRLGNWLRRTWRSWSRFDHTRLLRKVSSSTWTNQRQ